ncbi:hypothetical protein [Dysgonomonas sp. HGC4]|uniref:hypothetical protein n=1 Tax=Dysgonomonas sp. HGC4 TaxID=1658009 RepID=UPI000A8FA078|nr:hypothetical protein [Dysgonomonas sp. HGC4]MBD8348553.1 hypothetical protein [Dysgonomonas sp. HGC4]
MDAAKFLNSIENIKQHGDAVRISKLVNKLRLERGETSYSPATVRSMLNGNRTANEEVIEIAKKFYKTQLQFEEQSL